MAKKTIGVLPVRQNGHTLLVAAISAKDLFEYTEIDRFRSALSASDPDQGYQRPEETARAKKVAKYVSGDDPLMPTALLLNARNHVELYDEATQTFTLDDASRLQLIDGQHRRAGLRYAIYELRNPLLLDFQVPVVITLGLSKIEEMSQFRTVNGTQKSVRTDLVNMILTKLAADQGDAAIAAKDVWRVVVSRATEKLNAAEASVWHDKIVMPDESAYTRRQIEENPELANRKIVRATSFMQSLKPLYTFLVDNGHIPDSWDTDRKATELARIVSDYWSAITSLCPEPFAAPKEYVIQKTPGVFSLHMTAKLVLRKLYILRKDFVESEFEDVLRPTLDDDNAVVLDEDFWRADGGRASDFGSMKGFADLASIIETDFRVDQLGG